MRILIDENIPYGNEFFDSLGKVERFAGRSLQASQLVDADILLVRSITKVNASLLTQANRLRFVGTATIGEDHIDKELLASKGINYSSAPGCNANSVAEYIISSLLVVAEVRRQDFSTLQFAIIGFGNIGKNLYTKLTALGITPMVVDPFECNNSAHSMVNFVEFDKAIGSADVISFHTPLTREGEHPTYHLLNEHNIQNLKPSVCVLNASRGEVIDNQALYVWKTRNPQSSLIIDCWEGEPNLYLPLISECLITTPHIAGYSLEGKAKATEYLYSKVCNHLNQAPEIQLQTLLPQFNLTNLSVNVNELQLSYQNVLKQIVHLVYDVRSDDAEFRRNFSTKGFDWLRKNYPIRREWSAITLKCTNPKINAQLSQLGFSVSES